MTKVNLFHRNVGEGCGFTKPKGQQEELSSLMIKRKGEESSLQALLYFFHHLIE